ncbi:hypothetical protein ACFE04_000582 [Oxalis oulophora]
MDIKERGIHVIMFPLPLQGHINPMLQLANILYSKGFSITIVHTNFNSPNPNNFPHFSFHQIPDGLSSDGSDLNDVIAMVKLLNVNCLDPFRTLLTELLLSNGPRVACLITDASLHFTQPIADEIKLPRLVLRTSDVSSFLMKNYPPIKDSLLEAQVFEFLPLKVKDLPEIKTGNSEDFHEHKARRANMIKASSGLIWNSFEELEHDALDKCRQEFPIPVFPIGPFYNDVWCIGVHLEYNMEREHIEKSIRKLMEDVGIQERAWQLKEKVDQCLNPGGSSSKALDSLVNYISSL